MMTDIEIAQNAEMKHIKEVAAKLGISEDDLDMYGKYKAKLSDELIRKSRATRMESSSSSQPSIQHLQVRERRLSP